MFQKIIKVGFMKEPQFPHLGTFYIRKIQTFLRRNWLNNRLPKINRFYMCISYIGLSLVFTSSPSFICTAIYGNVHDGIYAFVPNFE